MNSNTNTSMRGRGLFGWLMALTLIGFYVLLYWDSDIDANAWQRDAFVQFDEKQQSLKANKEILTAKLEKAKPAAELPKDGYTQADSKEALTKDLALVTKEIKLNHTQRELIRYSLTKHASGYEAWGKSADKQLNAENKQLVDKLRSEHFIYQRVLQAGAEFVAPVYYALGQTDRPDKWFLYGFIYTLLIVGFGYKFIRTWRGNQYQKYRTISVMTVQLVLAFILPYMFKLISGDTFYLSYFWPLKFEYIFPTKLSGLPIALTIWTLTIAFIGVPVLTYFFGKRWYCSWVCGCGALANTFGDQWRHLSDKSRKAWRFEKVSVHTVLAITVLATIWIMYDFFTGSPGQGSAGVKTAKSIYAFAITAGFAGVVGTGFYPLAGTRVWCRFGCPQAALLGIIQVFFSRFRITVNGDQCMSCGNCSTYCEMGIDVRAYAMEGKSFARASCVGCGLCSTTCPRGVLKLETKKDGRGDVVTQF